MVGVLTVKSDLENNYPLLQSHKTWTAKTVLLALVDICLKPILALFLVSNFLFIVWRIMPGDPLSIMISGPMPPPAIQVVIQLWGFDQPLHIQYFRFIGNIFTLNIYQTLSLTGGFRSVGEFIAPRLPNTLLLLLVPFLLVTLIAIFYTWFARNQVDQSEGWPRRFYTVVFTKSTWIIFTLGILWVGWQLAFVGILPLYGSVSYPPPENPFLLFLDVGWHLLMPGLILGLSGIAILVHYLYQAPGEELTPLSHVLPRMYVWMAALTLPLEILYSWNGIGRAFFNALFQLNYPVLLAILVTFLFVIGIPAIILEAVLRWVLYRNPVELHGQKALVPEKNHFRDVSVLFGLVLVIVVIVIAVIASLLFPSYMWPPMAPIESSLTGLYPLLNQAFVIGMGATLIGGVLGLASNVLFRAKIPFILGYIPSFLLSLWILTLFMQPILPFTMNLPYGTITNIATLILSVGVVRRISNTALGKGKILLLNWALSLLPLLVLYTLIGGIVAFLAGFTGITFTTNLGFVVSSLINSGTLFTNPTILFIPAGLFLLFVLAFDILWCGLRHPPSPLFEK
jgi:peptide/nickel transport system permease protein